MARIHHTRIPVGPSGWLACRQSGPEGQADAPLLVFLHGFPEAAFVWDGMLERFGGRFRCVAPNLRGYADSHAPADVGAYKAHVVLGDLVALLDALGGRAHAVIAHDWGGALAWGLAAVAPQVMDKLVILNAPHPGLFLRALRDDPAQQAASDYMNVLRAPGAEARLAADDFAGLWPFFERFGGAGWLTPALREQYRQAWSAAPQAAADETAAPSALTGPLNYYRASPLYPPTSPQDPVHRLQLPDALLRVNVPTRVIWGEADTALPARLLDGLDAYVPDLKVTRLAGLTHWLVHEDPETVGAVIERALEPDEPTQGTGMTRPLQPDALPVLISAEELSALLARPTPIGQAPVVLDCRFNLMQPAAGEQANAQGHVPGARYAHLDRDLSGPKTGHNGRHPFPTAEAFARTLTGWGITPATRVVVYDDGNGMFAARAWWMLQWAGVAQVQVLDGGWAAWLAAGGTVEEGGPGLGQGSNEAQDAQKADPAGGAAATAFHFDDTLIVPTSEVEQGLASVGREWLLVDARAPDRFRGENETLDPVGGHIPGAANRFFQLNLDASTGRFKPASALRAEFEALLQGHEAQAVVHQCGSGVTACHNLLAMAHAGLPGARLYAGSWSEWVADPGRPVAR